MGYAAQVSLYPLSQSPFEPPIDEAINTFREYELEMTVGALSTLLVGAEEEIFAALKEALRSASAHGPVVMVVTLTNACPT